MLPTEHAELIEAAKSATCNGNMHGAKWVLLPDEERGVNNVDPRRQHMSDALGSVIYDPKTPQFAGLGLSCYNELWGKLNKYGFKKVVVRVKGGNAAAFQVSRLLGAKKALDAGFGFSDLDIDILINPSLSPAEFNAIKADVQCIVGRTLAVHKRRVDRCFFKSREADNENEYFMGDHDKKLFKELATNSIETLTGAISCFESEQSRNKSSSISYLITPSRLDSEVDIGAKRRLKIEQKHLVKAERVPLPHTPVYVTVNDTISGQRSTGGKVDFVLSRIKIGNIVVNPQSERVKLVLRVHNDAADTDAADATAAAPERISLQIIQPYEKISADFVDVWVGNQEDEQLLDFWKRGGFVGKLTQDIHVVNNRWTIIVPTLEDCKEEYYKLLHVFECPESKREKRERKYKALQSLCKGRTR